jgi:hypothetical protein
MRPEILSSGGRRRHCSPEEKTRLVGGWREDIGGRAEARDRSKFDLCVAASARSAAKKTGLIEMDLGGGKRIRVDADVDADALGRVLDVHPACTFGWRPAIRT